MILSLKQNVKIDSISAVKIQYLVNQILPPLKREIMGTRFWASFWASSILLWMGTLGGPVQAETTITVDGNAGDWAGSDAQCATDYAASQASDYVDIVSICATDSFSSDGDLYLLLEFAEDNSYRSNYWLWYADLVLHVDTDGDGSVDATLDFMDAPADQLNGVISLPYLEVRVDYDIVDPDGDREFSFFVESSWDDSPADRVPYDDSIMIDYAVDPESGSPRAVRMLNQNAIVNDTGVDVNWTTASERSNAGFHVFRLDVDTKKWVRLTDSPLPGLGDSSFGAAYTYQDSQGLAGDVYQILDLEFSGAKKFHGRLVAQSDDALIDSYIPQMVARFDRPFDFDARLRRVFANIPRHKQRKTNANAMKFQVDAHGLYYLPYQEVEELAGGKKRKTVGLRIDEQRLAVLKDKQGLYFLGAPNVDRYADYDVVIADNRRSPKMTQRRVRNNCFSHESIFMDTLRIEKDINYYIATPTDDPFFWGAVYAGSPSALAFELPGFVEGQVELNVSLVGFAQGAAGPDHTASFYLNGTELGNWQWNGKGQETVSLLVPSGVMAASNELTVSLIAGEMPDMLSIDNIVVSYNKELKLQEGQLRFDANSGTCLSIETDASDLLVFDITNPLEPTRLRGFDFREGQLQFRTPRPQWHHRAKKQSRERSYLVVSKDAARRPIPGAPMTDAKWLNGQRTADYVIVTHPLFKPAADELAAYYQSTMNTLVVTTDMLYDKYSGGRPHPDAIRQFLMEANKNFAAPPRYVLLFGGATVDSNDVLGLGDEDFVPSYYYKTNLMGYEAVSDHSFVTGLNDMMIGRLPVQSTAQAHSVVDKLLDWYQRGETPIGTSVVVADHDNSGGDINTSGEFEDAAEVQIAAHEGSGQLIERFYLNQVQSPMEALGQLVNEGVDALSFHGHAYVSGWSSPQIANLESAKSMSNEHLFFAMSWSCFDGSFAGPYDDSLAWQFVANPTGGAYGALAASSLADPRFVEQFSVNVTRQLSQGAQSVGEAVMLARQEFEYVLTYGALDTIYTYNLLADPAAPSPW